MNIVNIVKKKQSEGHKIIDGLGLIINEVVGLSNRERECLLYLLQGSTAKQTAKSIGISNRTVETHISNIKVKLGLKNKGEIVFYLFKEFFIA